MGGAGWSEGGRERGREGGLTLTTLVQEAPGLFGGLLGLLAGEGGREGKSEGRESGVRAVACKLLVRLVDVILFHQSERWLYSDYTKPSWWE